MVFQPLKHYHTLTVDMIVRSGITQISKVDFLSFIQDIRIKAFKTTTIQAAFKRTRIYPFYPKIVLDRIEERRASIIIRDITPDRPLNSSPFGTPMTPRKLDRVARQLEEAISTQSQAELTKNIQRFTRGAMIQSTELFQAKAELAQTRIAETTHHLRRMSRRSRIQTGGILTVDQGRDLTRTSPRDKIQKAYQTIREYEEQQAVQDRQLAQQAAQELERS